MMMKAIRSFTNWVLIVLQWLLVLLGLLMIVFAVRNYMAELRFFSSLAEITPDPETAPDQSRDSYYVLPTIPSLLYGVAIGAISMGIGTILFYLRRIFLRQKD